MSAPALAATPPAARFSAVRRWFEVNLAVVLLGAFFLPWHVVHHTSALEGLFRQEPPPPTHDVGEPFVCSGFSHNQREPWIPLLLGVLVVVSVLSRSRPAMAYSAMKVGACLGIVALLSSQLLQHLFDRQEPRPAEYVFLLGLLLMLLVGIGRITARMYAVVRERRRLRQNAAA